MNYDQREYRNAVPCHQSGVYDRRPSYMYISGTSAAYVVNSNTTARNIRDINPIDVKPFIPFGRPEVNVIENGCKQQQQHQIAELAEICASQSPSTLGVANEINATAAYSSFSDAKPDACLHSEHKLFDGAGDYPKQPAAHVSSSSLKLAITKKRMALQVDDDSELLQEKTGSHLFVGSVDAINDDGSSLGNKLIVDSVSNKNDADITTELPESSIDAGTADDTGNDANLSSFKENNTIAMKSNTLERNEPNLTHLNQVDTDIIGVIKSKHQVELFSPDATGNDSVNTGASYSVGHFWDLIEMLVLVWFKPNKLHPSVAKIIYWHNKVQTAICLCGGIGLGVAFSLASAINVIALVLTMTLYVTLHISFFFKALEFFQINTPTAPFLPILNTEITLPKEQIQHAAGLAVDYLCILAVELRRLLFIENFSTSFKFAFILYIITGIGYYINLMDIFILYYAFVLLLPKLCESNKSVMISIWNSFYSRFCTVRDKAQAILDACPKKAPIKQRQC